MNKKHKIILIVEDEKSYIDILSEKLTHEGYDILVAKNGQEGLNTAFKEHPDLILLDLNMPEMDGIEMMKKLREDLWGNTAKVIVLTNVTDIEKLQSAMENEVFKYLVKSDSEIEKLVNEIKSVIS